MCASPACGVACAADSRRRSSAVVDASLQQGWITSEWKTTETNRRARYYSLTRAGRKAVVEEAANWERLSAAISGIVRAI